MCIPQTSHPPNPTVSQHQALWTRRDKDLGTVRSSGTPTHNTHKEGNLLFIWPLPVFYPKPPPSSSAVTLAQKLEETPLVSFYMCFPFSATQRAFIVRIWAFMLMQLCFVACQISSVVLQAPLKAPFDARWDGMVWVGCCAACGSWWECAITQMDWRWANVKTDGVYRLHYCPISLISRPCYCPHSIGFVLNPRLITHI